MAGCDVELLNVTFNLVWSNAYDFLLDIVVESSHGVVEGGAVLKLRGEVVVKDSDFMGWSRSGSVDDWGRSGGYIFIFPECRETERIEGSTLNLINLDASGCMIRDMNRRIKLTPTGWKGLKWISAGLERSVKYAITGQICEKIILPLRSCKSASPSFFKAAITCNLVFYLNRKLWILWMTGSWPNLSKSTEVLSKSKHTQRCRIQKWLNSYYGQETSPRLTLERFFDGAK